MNRVLVIDKNKQPLMPCHPARARELLRKGMVEITQPKGKYAGHYTARVSAIKSTGPISIQIDGKQTWFGSKLAKIVQRTDGYRYD